MSRPRRPAVERWAKLTRKDADECWRWTGNKTKGGYGLFREIPERTVMAHRFAYEYFVGPIPHGMALDHLCRNPSCVNPAPLEPVTCRENLFRSPFTQASINRAKTHCVRGHLLSGTNVRIRKNGTRQCMLCFRLRDRLAKRAARGRLIAQAERQVVA